MSIQIVQVQRKSSRSGEWCRNRQEGGYGEAKDTWCHRDITSVCTMTHMCAYIPASEKLHRELDVFLHSCNDWMMDRCASAQSAYIPSPVFCFKLGMTLSVKSPQVCKYELICVLNLYVWESMRERDNIYERYCICGSVYLHSHLCSGKSFNRVFNCISWNAKGLCEDPV